MRKRESLARLRLAGPVRRPWPGAFLFVWLATAALVLLGVPAFAAGDGQLLRIGTGGQTGVYYPIGRLIAQGLTAAFAEAAGTNSAGRPTISVAQITAGSVANVQALAAGEIEAGLVQADVAYRAVAGIGEFAGNPAAQRIRAVASLYPEKLQLVTRRDAAIATLADLPGKRFAIDEIGSGTLAVMRIVLAAHNLSEKDFAAVYLKPVYTAEKMGDGSLQGFAMVAGTPMEAVTRLTPIGLHLVPIAERQAGEIAARYPYLVPGTIAAGVYPGIPETPTLQVHALLLVAESLDEELVHHLTSGLWGGQTAELLALGHPLGGEITLATALDGLSIPLHPGAERFYRQQGMLQGGGP